MKNNSTIGSSNSNFSFKYRVLNKNSEELGYPTYPLSTETFSELEQVIHLSVPILSSEKGDVNNILLRLVMGKEHTHIICESADKLDMFTWI